MVGTNPNDGVRRQDGEDASQEVTQGHSEQIEPLESVTPIASTPEIDRDYILGRFVEVGFGKEDAEALLDQYVNYPLTLPVTDQPMRRISEVLTDKGFITTETCDGHGSKLPIVFLRTEDRDHMRHLTHIITRDSRMKHFDWTLRAWSSNPFLNPDSPMAHVLEPSNTSGNPVDPTADYENLKRDLDIIALCVLDYFNDVEAAEQEEAEQLQEKIERGLIPVDDRIESMNNLIVELGCMDGASPVRPRIDFIWDGEQDDYKEKGEIVEEYTDGFVVLTEENVATWEQAFEGGSFHVKDGYKLAHFVTDRGLVYSFPMKKSEPES